jgi:poly-gamma-glutamate synthesis protein (capsule biosynthesis protein)
LVHWGAGLSDELAEYQRPLGYALIDAGADVVVGSHPHRVLGVECYRGKAIFYSPGTLIEQLSRDGVSPEVLASLALSTPDSFIATLDISIDGNYSIRITPTTLADHGIPDIAIGDAFERIADRIVRMSGELGTPVEAVDGQLLITAST